MHENLILKTDSYKASHFRQYPPGTEHVYSYLESRGGLFDSTVFFGLQYVLKRHLTGVRIQPQDLDDAELVLQAHLGRSDCFHRAGWEHILKHHGGELPLEIRAVREGTDVPTGNVLLTMVNTDPAVPWLTNYIETLLMQLWYPLTVCTNSHRLRALILRYLEETGSPEQIDFKLHDFGYRGVTCHEQAAIGGLAHLVNFKGTDTLAAITAAHQYYSCPMAGFSIPATEHSTITSWGPGREGDAYRNFLEQFPTGTIACVSDSYNIYHACRELWGNQLRGRVTERDGVLVVRPDSGTPHEVVRKVVMLLDQQFGGSQNKKGYRVLNPAVRVIQGDGVEYDSIDQIYATLKHEGYSADNAGFGSGGALLQKLNRDTQQMAFKCSAIRINGEWQDVYKDPVEGHGKRSKRGRLSLVHENGRLSTGAYGDPVDQLRPVFRNGELLVDERLDTVRLRAGTA